MKRREDRGKSTSRAIGGVMKIDIQKPSDEEISEMKQNPIWECEPSEFPWQYDVSETC
ncbi:MAG: hypothetical protein SCARUB_05213, partial [Candidatus Scalindua rubra]